VPDVVTFRIGARVGGPPERVTFWRNGRAAFPARPEPGVDESGRLVDAGGPHARSTSGTGTRSRDWVQDNELHAMGAIE
jgi:hypothetical protein